jgi:hypothetical protein
MRPPPDPALFDKQVRAQIYAHFLQTEQAPRLRDVARALDSKLPAARAAVRRLAEARAIVLQADGEVLMAEPFSAVPTPFVVQIGARRWWGNCIWDALGIAAMLRADAHVLTSCGCCGLAMPLEVRDGALRDAPGIAHYAVPARDWWKDVVFT